MCGLYLIEILFVTWINDRLQNVVKRVLGAAAYQHVVQSNIALLFSVADAVILSQIFDGYDTPVTPTGTLNTDHFPPIDGGEFGLFA